MKTGLILLTISAAILCGCVDNESFCREPGYLCADHASQKDRICVLPGYTCTPADDEEDKDK